MIDRQGPLSVRRQCTLLGLSRSGCYYTPRPVSERDLDLMLKIDEHHLSHPSHGSRRIQDGLLDLGFAIGRDHVRSLMCRMGFEAVYPKPRLSQPHPAHKIYPYLLRSLLITRANHVWATDITYIYKPQGTVQTTPTTSLFVLWF
jgi:putative transposase